MITASQIKPRGTAAPEPLELDPQRTFSDRQKIQLFQRSEGKCDLCGDKVIGTWTAGHRIPWALGGRTTIENGVVECDARCSPETHKEDTGRAAKAKRQARETGQQARRKRNGSQIRSRGFVKSLTRKIGGKVVPRKLKR